MKMMKMVHSVAVSLSSLLSRSPPSLFLSLLTWYGFFIYLPSSVFILCSVVHSRSVFASSLTCLSTTYDWMRIHHYSSVLNPLLLLLFLPFNHSTFYQIRLLVDNFTRLKMNSSNICQQPNIHSSFLIGGDVYRCVFRTPFFFWRFLTK